VPSVPTPKIRQSAKRGELPAARYDEPALTASVGQHHGVRTGVQAAVPQVHGVMPGCLQQTGKGGREVCYRTSRPAPEQLLECLAGKAGDSRAAFGRELLGLRAQLGREAEGDLGRDGGPTGERGATGLAWEPDPAAVERGVVLLELPGQAVGVGLGHDGTGQCGPGRQWVLGSFSETRRTASVRLTHE
jgi:hypothetical protein